MYTKESANGGKIEEPLLYSSSVDLSAVVSGTSINIIGAGPGHLLTMGLHHM